MRLLVTVIILSIATSCGQEADTEDKVVISDPVIPQPRFPGDSEGLKKYVKENYKWTQGQLTVEGKVFVEFSILEDGSVSEPKIIRGLCETCDKEAIRLIKGMPKWLPATQNGKRRTERVVLGIKFGLTNPYE